VFAAPPTPSAPPSTSRGTTLDRVVAVVNDGVVLESDLNSEVQAVSQRLRAQNVALPAEQLVREQVLERLVLETIQDQHAEHAGITVSDEQVNSALQDIARRNNVSFEQLPNKLAAEGLVYADYRSNLRREISASSTRRDRTGIGITPRELEQYIERQKGTASANNEYNISHILVAIAQDANPGQLAAARAKAEDLVTRARGGEAFNQLAVSFSDSQTALDGGTLGWLKGPALPTFLADIVPRMKPGQISDVIQTGSGFHLVRLNDMRTATNTQIVKQTHLRHILLKTTESQDDATVRQKLSEMRAQVLAGADFAVLAKASSVIRAPPSKGAIWAGRRSRASRLNLPARRTSSRTMKSASPSRRSLAGTSCRCSAGAILTTPPRRNASRPSSSCARAVSMRRLKSGCSSCVTRLTSN
jgi:peptidyl-prolyl cis-trans isomerase SurA